MKRPCIDCGTPTQADRCDPCRLVRNRRRIRASSIARGYDKHHKEARSELITMLPAWCAYGCGTLLHTATDMVAAHVIDGDPTAGWQAACRSCNERAKRKRVRE